MPKRLLIIGNGFDIDLGLRTRYSDFAKSNFWEKLMRNTHGFDQDLLAALREAKEKEAWFDIEKTMTLNPQLHSRSATYKRGMDF